MMHRPPPHRSPATLVLLTAWLILIFGAVLVMGLAE
jgi:hypothetical protein